jgi:hypothetical protein
MTRQRSVVIATRLDGFIARQDGSLDALERTQAITGTAIPP